LYDPELVTAIPDAEKEIRDRMSTHIVENSDSTLNAKFQIVLPAVHDRLDDLQASIQSL